MKSDHVKPFESPDGSESYEKVKIDTIELAGYTLQRFIFEPGWRWSENLKQIAGTHSCVRHHFGVQVSGKLRVKFDTGEELEIKPGDAFDIPPGHDSWVVGETPVVWYDFGTSIAAMEAILGWRRHGLKAS